MQKHILSKSTFIKGLQCEKALYLSKFHRELRDELSSQKEAIFSQGNKVGQLSNNYFLEESIAPLNLYLIFKKRSLERKKKLKKELL